MVSEIQPSQDFIGKIIIRKIFLLIICLEIDINIIKREVVYSSFLLIIISVLFSLFSFNSLTVDHKKLPCMIFTKK